MVFIKRILAIVPLTTRGTVVALLSAFFLLGPARQESDIIATVIGFGLAFILILSGLMTLISWLVLRRNLQIFLEGAPDVHARTKAVLTFKTSPIKLPPFVILAITFRFSRSSMTTTEHRLKGQSGDSRILLEPLNFPHRGLWSIAHAEVALGDQLGLWRRNWRWTSPELSSPIRVMPPEAPDILLPVISSASRAGDSTSHNQQPLGDLYDLKAYNPSDGMRKIVWKIFARTGQLVSRHPERAMTPEGLTVIFVAADREEDLVARQALTYVKFLESMALNIACGATGMKDEPIATGREDLEELLLETAWEADTTDSIAGASAITKLLNQAIAAHPGHTLSQVVIFTGPPTDPAEERYLEAMGQALAGQAITPIMIPIIDDNKPMSEAPSGIWVKLKNLIVESAQQGRGGHATFSSLSRICSARGWEIIAPG